MGKPKLNRYRFLGNIYGKQDCHKEVIDFLFSYLDVFDIRKLGSLGKVTSVDPNDHYFIIDSLLCHNISNKGIISSKTVWGMCLVQLDD